MRNCNKCFENNWSFNNIDGFVIATCNNCFNEVEFEMKSKVKIKEGNKCRKCDGLLVKQVHKKKWKKKEGQLFWYEWWLKCLKCRTIYMIEEAKRYE